MRRENNAEMKTEEIQNNIVAAFICLRTHQRTATDDGVSERVENSHRAESACLLALKARASLERLSNSVRSLLLEPSVRKEAANWASDELIECREAIDEAMRVLS